MKKLLSLILALCLLSTAACFAEGSIGTLYDAAKALAFDTHNVTLSAEAEFLLDGELFKTMHASYKQDGYRSYLSYMLDTPKLDGSVYTGGYTVYGNANTAYANDTYFGNYYRQTYIIPTDTVLRMNPRTQMLLSLGREMALMAQSLVKESAGEGETRFEVGDLSPVLDAGIYYLLADYIQDNYYRDMFGLYDSGSYGTMVYYEDFDALAGSRYQALYGTALPEGEMDAVTSARYQLVLNALEQLEQELQTQYTDGCVYVTKDGTAQHYDSFDELMRANNDVYTTYWNDTEALKDYYAKFYGEELTDEFFNILIYSPNPELWGAYVDLINEMDEYYADLARQQDPECLSVLVRKDGSISTYDYRVDDYHTTTQQILSGLSFAELKSLNASVKTDDEGRLTGFAGKAEIELTNRNTKRLQTLTISFDCKAQHYGTTSVPESFVPEQYGLVSYEEFINAETTEEYDYEAEMAEWNKLVNDAPETISFMGKTYETMMDTYKQELEEDEAKG